MKSEKLSGFKGLKGIWALRLKLYLELSFRILKIIVRFNFKLHFEPQATKKVKNAIRMKSLHFSLFTLLPSPSKFTSPFGEGLGVRLGVRGEAFIFHFPPLGEAGKGLGNAVEAVQIIRASGAVFVS